MNAAFVPLLDSVLVATEIARSDGKVSSLGKGTHNLTPLNAALRSTRVMENRSLLDRFGLHKHWVQIALRAALAIVVTASAGFAILRNRTIVQRDVASCLARDGCVLGYSPARLDIPESVDEDDSQLGFHARHSLVAVTIHSLERADELVAQLSRIDTVKTIRIEYASSSGCLFTVAPELAAIEKIKTTFPNATVEVKITLIAVVG